MMAATVAFTDALSALTFHPVLAAPLVVMLMIAGALAAIVMYVHRASAGHRGLLGVRLIVVAALGLVLLNPSRAESPDGSSNTRPTLCILVDTSASMALSDDNGPTRWAEAVKRLNEAKAPARWTAPADVRWYRFDQSLQAADWPALQRQMPTGRQSRLVDALSRLLGQPDLPEGATVLLISDGHDTTEIAPAAAVARLADLAEARRIAVSVMPIGSTAQPPDLALHAYATPDQLFDDQAVTLHVDLHHSGYAGRSVRLALARDGRPVESTVLKLPGAGQPATLTFTDRPARTPDRPRQLVHYTVTVDGVPGEATTANNRRDLFVRHIGRRLRVVLFEGRPYWETRFLLRALRGDRQIDLTSVQALRADRLQTIRYGGEPTDPPTRWADLAGYDVVILGRGIERFFPGERARLLARFVAERGGGLMLARGRPFADDSSPAQTAGAIVQPLEPARWGRGLVNHLRLQLTEAGRRLTGDVRIDRLPGMIAATRNEGVKSAAVVLLRQRQRDADGPEMAAAAYQRIGHGRVLQIMTEGLWRWAMQPADRSEGPSAYRSFMGNSVRWLAGADDLIGPAGVALMLDRHAAGPGESVSAEVRSINQSARQVLAAGYTLRLIDPDQQHHALSATASLSDPNRLVAGWVPDKPGLYTVELLGPDRAVVQEDRLACDDPADEKLQGGARPDFLTALARRTGGMVIAADQPIPDLATLAAAAHTDRADVADNLRYQPAWLRWWVFVALIAAMSAEWMIRRTRGLP